MKWPGSPQRKQTLGPGWMGFLPGCVLGASLGPEGDCCCGGCSAPREAALGVTTPPLPNLDGMPPPPPRKGRCMATDCTAAFSLLLFSAEVTMLRIPPPSTNLFATSTPWVSATASHSCLSSRMSSPFFRFFVALLSRSDFSALRTFSRRSWSRALTACWCSYATFLHLLGPVDVALERWR